MNFNTKEGTDMGENLSKVGLLGANYSDAASMTKASTREQCIQVPELERVCDRLQSITETLMTASQVLDNIGDNLFGASPEGACEAAIAPNSPGRLSAMHHAFDVLDNVTADIVRHAERLNQL